MRYCETCCGGLTPAGRQAPPPRQSLTYFPPLARESQKGKGERKTHVDSLISEGGGRRKENK